LLKLGVLVFSCAQLSASVSHQVCVAKTAQRDGMQYQKSALEQHCRRSE
jgi:hypothetical protein